MENREKVIYSINIKDVKDVAQQEFDIELSEHDLIKIENKIGDYIDWYRAIVDVINDAKLKS